MKFLPPKKIFTSLTVFSFLLAACSSSSPHNTSDLSDSPYGFIPADDWANGYHLADELIVSSNLKYRSSELYGDYLLSLFENDEKLAHAIAHKWNGHSLEKIWEQKIPTGLADYGTQYGNYLLPQNLSTKYALNLANGETVPLNWELPNELMEKEYGPFSLQTRLISDNPIYCSGNIFQNNSAIQSDPFSKIASSDLWACVSFKVEGTVPTWHVEHNQNGSDSFPETGSNEILIFDVQTGKIQKKPTKEFVVAVFGDRAIFLKDKSVGDYPPNLIRGEWYSIDYSFDFKSITDESSKSNLEMSNECSYAKSGYLTHKLQFDTKDIQKLKKNPTKVPLDGNIHLCNKLDENLGGVFVPERGFVQLSFEKLTTPYLIPAKNRKTASMVQRIGNRSSQCLLSAVTGTPVTGKACSTQTLLSPHHILEISKSATNTHSVIYQIHKSGKSE